MTDVLLSPTEQAPNGKGGEAKDRVECPHCDKSWPATPGARLWIANHTKHKHPEHYVKAAAPAKKKAPAKKAAPRQVAPKPSTPVARPPAARPVPRVSVAPRVAWLWEKLGTVLQAHPAPQMAAVGNALMFEAPAAGQAFDKAVAGSRIDRRVQRFAKMGERWEGVTNAVKLPGLVFVIGTNPALIGPLEPDLREAIEDVLIDAIPAIEERAAKRAKAEKALARLVELDPEKYGDDPIGVVLADMLSPILAAMQRQTEDMETAPA